MKILHIFGAVVAVHLAVFLVIFAVPGCRSTGKAPQASASAESSSPAAAAADPAPLTASGLTPASSAPDAGSAGVAFTPPTVVRFSPTRPGTTTANMAASPAVGGGEPKSTATYLVSKGDSLWTVAKKNGVSVAELTRANNLKASTPLKLGQKLIIPASANAQVSGGSDKTAAALSAETGPSHTVKGGETLGQIAKQHGTSVNTLKRMNKLTSDVVRPGRVLLLPEGSVSSMDPVATAAPAPAATAARRTGGTFKHVVKARESVSTIAKLYGISVGELATANNIQDPAKIRLGQELTIPGWSAPKTPQAPSAASVPSTTLIPSSTPEPESASPLTPVAPEANSKPSTDVPVIRIEDSTRTPGTEASRTP